MNAARKNKDHHIYLGLGSNIDPEINMSRAVALLRQEVEVETLSSVWESPPAEASGPNFLNAVALVHTNLPADELRNQILRPLEASLGRVRTSDPNAPRTIDLDILIMDGEVLDTEIWKRAFLALPLSELLPDYAHPESGKSLLQIAQRLAQSTPIYRHPMDLKH